MMWNLQSYLTTVLKNECDILGGQNILWPLLHIFRGSGLPNSPWSTPLHDTIIFHVSFPSTTADIHTLHHVFYLISFIISFLRCYVAVPLRDHDMECCCPSVSPSLRPVRVHLSPEDKVVISSLSVKKILSVSRVTAPLSIRMVKGQGHRGT